MNATVEPFVPHHLRSPFQRHAVPHVLGQQQGPPLNSHPVQNARQDPSQPARDSATIGPYGWSGRSVHQTKSHENPAFSLSPGCRVPIRANTVGPVPARLFATPTRHDPPTWTDGPSGGNMYFGSGSPVEGVSLLDALPNGPMLPHTIAPSYLPYRPSHSRAPLPFDVYLDQGLNERLCSLETPSLRQAGSEKRVAPPYLPASSAAHSHEAKRRHIAPEPSSNGSAYPDAPATAAPTVPPGFENFHRRPQPANTESNRHGQRHNRPSLLTQHLDDMHQRHHNDLRRSHGINDLKVWTLTSLPGPMYEGSHYIAPAEQHVPHLTLEGPSLFALRSSLDFFLPNFSPYEVTNQLLCEIHHAQPAVRHLDITETWRGLSSEDAQRLITWEKALRSELSEVVRPYLPLNHPGGHVSSTDGMLGLSEEYLTISIPMTDFVVGVAERVRNARPPKSNSAASRMALYKDAGLFAAAHHCFFPCFDNDSKAEVYFIPRSPADAKIYWNPPRICFQDFSILALEGQVFQLYPTVEADAFGLGSYDTDEVDIEWSSDCDWLDYDGELKTFTGICPYVNTPCAPTPLAHNLPSPYGTWLPVTVKASLSYPFMNEKFYFEQCLRARIEILVMPNAPTGASIPYIRRPSGPWSSKHDNEGTDKRQKLPDYGFQVKDKLSQLAEGYSNGLAGHGTYQDVAACDQEIVPPGKPPHQPKLSHPSLVHHPQQSDLPRSGSAYTPKLRLRKPKTQHIEHSPFKVAVGDVGKPLDNAETAVKYNQREDGEDVAGSVQATPREYYGVPAWLEQRNDGEEVAESSKVSPRESDSLHSGHRAPEAIENTKGNGDVKSSSMSEASATTVFYLPTPVSNPPNSYNEASSPISTASTRGSLDETVLPVQCDSNKFSSLRGRSDMDDWKRRASSGFSSRSDSPNSTFVHRSRSIARSGSRKRESASERLERLRDLVSRDPAIQYASIDTTHKSVGGLSTSGVPVQSTAIRGTPVEENCSQNGAPRQSQRQSDQHTPTTPISTDASVTLSDMQLAAQKATETAISAIPLDGSSDARDVREMRKAVFELEMEKIYQIGGFRREGLANRSRYHDSSDWGDVFWSEGSNAGDIDQE